MPECSACGADRPAGQYSKAQLGKKSLRKCRDCVTASLRACGDADAALASQQSARAAAGSDPRPPNPVPGLKERGTAAFQRQEYAAAAAHYEAALLMLARQRLLLAMTNRQQSAGAGWA